MLNLETPSSVWKVDNQMRSMATTIAHKIKKKYDFDWSKCMAYGWKIMWWNLLYTYRTEFVFEVLFTKTTGETSTRYISSNGLLLTIAQTGLKNQGERTKGQRGDYFCTSEFSELGDYKKPMVIRWDAIKKIKRIWRVDTCLEPQKVQVAALAA